MYARMHVHSHCRASNQFVQNTSVGNVCLGGGELHVFSVGVQAAPMHLSQTNPLHDTSERRWQPRKGHSTVGGFPLPRSASQSNRQLHSHTMHAATSGTSCRLQRWHVFTNWAWAQATRRRRKSFCLEHRQQVQSPCAISYCAAPAVRGVREPQ